MSRIESRYFRYLVRASMYSKEYCLKQRNIYYYKMLSGNYTTKDIGMNMYWYQLFLIHCNSIEEIREYKLTQILSS